MRGIVEEDRAQKKKKTLIIALAGIGVFLISVGGTLLFLYLRSTTSAINHTQTSVSNEVVNNAVNGVPVNVSNATQNHGASNIANVTNTTNNSVPKPEPTPVPSPTTTDFSEISRGDSSKKQIIFTFDGGSGTQSGQKILEVLDKHQTSATFFLTGKFAEKNPQLTKDIVTHGNEIYNHTYSHPDLTTVSDVAIANELSHTEKIIQDLTGKSTKPYFRPPYGARNQHVLNVAKEEGYRSVFWTLDALDWKESSGQTASATRDRILSNIKPGAIILMHIGDTITGSILDDVLTAIETRGYAIVPLSRGVGHVSD